MVRGLDKRQTAAAQKSKGLIFTYIKEHEPVLSSQIIRGAGIKDHKITRKRLTELVREKRVSSMKLKYTQKKNKGRRFYYSIPSSEEISNIITKEEYLSKIGTKYYDGVKKDVPIDFQFAHKLGLLIERFQKLEQLFKEKSRGIDFEEITGFSQHNKQLIYDFFLILQTIAQAKINGSYFWLKEYYDKQLYSHIESLDKMFHNYKDLASNNKIGGPNKTFAARLLLENTKSGAMKKLNLSSKLGSKLERELFNADGSPKVAVINEINEKSIGMKEFLPYYPSGDTLLKIWKDMRD